MARIGITLSGIERSLLNRLAEANAAATLSTLRLAAGKKILHPSDDPATFVALGQLQNRLNVVTATMSNVTAASSIVTQTQSTLDQVRTQLGTIRTELLKDENQELTAEERAEAQAKIDTAIAQINSLATTQIDGRRVLDGSADFDVSGRNGTQVREVRVRSTGGAASQTISGSVSSAATRAELLYTGAGGQTTSAAVFTLTGDLGTASITVADEEDLSSVATKINNQSHNTGVTASVDGNELTLATVNYGSRIHMAVDVTSGAFATTGGNGDGTADGTDAAASINGHAVSGAAVDGNRFTVNRNGFHFEIEFAAGFTGDFNTMTVSGSALTFSLQTDLAYQDTLAIPGLQANRPGGLSGTLDQVASGGAVSGLAENTSQAIRIVDEALAGLTQVEGTVDGFYNAAITSSSSLLADFQEDLEDSITETDGYNETEESLLLATSQALASNAVAGLAILNQQRSSIVYLIQRIAGLA